MASQVGVNDTTPSFTVIKTDGSTMLFECPASVAIAPKVLTPMAPFQIPVVTM